MNRKLRSTVVFLALTAILVLAGFAVQQATTQKAQEKTEEMVVCPVSGETMKKSEAPVSWEYKGKTYYFCCQSCKDKFMKDPESFLKEKPSTTGTPAMAGMMMHQGQMKGQMMPGAAAGGCGMMMEGCPMMNKDVEVKFENTKDGGVITLSSKDPATVKLIQDHLAKMKDMRAKKMAEGMMKKEEPKKEPEKK